MKIFNNIPNKLIFFILISLFFFKILIYFLVKSQFISISFGGGNDSGYYHGYAIGQEDFAVNIWPVILYNLNQIGLYSRTSMSSILFFLNLLIIPLLMVKLSNLKFDYDQKNYLYMFLLVLLYPALFFYSLDVYRDVFMVFIFLLGCLVVKKTLIKSNFIYFCFLFFIALAVGFFLITLRPYLGYAFLISLFLWKIKLTKLRVIVFSILYFLTLFLVNYLGFLESLNEYRSGFQEELQGGSNLGLDFSNPIMFLPNFFLSALGQLFGLYLVNPVAVILLFVETLPVLFMLIYIVKNIRFADHFVRFLIIFFVLYASVWLIGNDNLGTAVRLRLYNYLVVYICFFYILKLKTHITNNNQYSLFTRKR